jgi:hypothetical protein
MAWQGLLAGWCAWTRKVQVSALRLPQVLLLTAVHALRYRTSCIGHAWLQAWG